MTIVGSLFGLPQSFFKSAGLPGEAQSAEASRASASAASPSTGPTASEPSSSSSSTWRESGATCLTCGIGVGCAGFSSPQEQRQHFKTDWHRYNVKRRLSKQPAVSEEQFESVLEQGTEVSISGSDSDSSEEEDIDEEEAGASGGMGQPGEGTSGPRQFRKKGAQPPAASQIPRETFQAQDGSLFSVWRCLLRQDHVKAAADQPATPAELLAELRRLRTACGTWMVVLLRGGHFAATVFKAREVRGASASSSAAKQDLKHDADWLEGFEVVAHKTFHRYVVRAKAGGKQSSKDATGKFAKSAGSRLRRYNEQALEREVQELLASWAAHVGGADLIFAQAGASNARSLFSEGQTTLLQSNPRLRRVPFITHRPTFSETKRVLRLLCSVFRPEAVEELLQQQQSAHLEDEAAAVVEALAAAKLADAPPSSAAGVAAGAGEGSARATGGASPATAEEDSAAAEAAVSAGAEGPLHRAAKAADPDRVKRLLEAGQDPCAKDGKGRTPYALAGDKDTRDAFRRYMAQHPDMWDYSASGIPSPLTEEMEAAALAKKAAHKAKLKTKDAERKGGGGAGPTAEERKRAAEAEAAAAHKQAVDDEIAAAAAEAAAIAARLNASAKQAASSGRGGGGGGSKVCGGAGRSRGSGSRGGGGGRGGANSAVGGSGGWKETDDGGGRDGGEEGSWAGRMWPVLLLGGLFAVTVLAERRRR